MKRSFYPYGATERRLLEAAHVKLRCLSGACTALLIMFLFSTHVSTAAEIGGSNGTNILIRKSRQVLELYQNGARVRTYRVCLGLNPDGPKRVTGDRKTPEGKYYICYKSTKSQFYRFLGLSYPGEKDAQNAFMKGIISLDKRDSIVSSVREGKKPPWNTKLGGWVGIHGYPTEENARRWVALLYPKPHNWTDGCIAMWNFEIEELFSLVSVGTPVTIMP